MQDHPTKHNDSNEGQKHNAIGQRVREIAKEFHQPIILAALPESPDDHADDNGDDHKNGCDGTRTPKTLIQCGRWSRGESCLSRGRTVWRQCLRRRTFLRQRWGCYWRQCLG